MSTPKAPAAPDPVMTAMMQNQLNRSTAITQQGLNMIDQVGPDGTLTYSQTGEQQFTDPLTGQKYSIPKYTATTQLSESGQRVQALNNTTQENIARIGSEQSARIGDLLGNPVQIGNEAAEARLFDLGSKRLDPMFQRNEEALRTRLVNQGLRPGTAAWDAEMSQFGQGRNDAYNQLLLQGRGQAVKEQLTERNQPLNEINALMSGSQVSQQNFIGTPQTQLAGTDYQGAVRDSYDAQMKGYAAQQQSQGAMLGGLFGLAGTLGGAGINKYSDRRLKRNIRHIGTLPNGLPVYGYEIGGRYEIGLMADEVRELRPEAVTRMPNGYDMVDYSKAVL
ncbi:tail fiber domain-containing protein [Enterovirga rhinocerotis]|uniref:Endosialidase-like protein n=1 Tax=Enterovirga rhinocerotis TaxID=1339210 RepID=A0A4R7CB22_9HYPH|nr:tail fiber domain-containing protein [Enterovirga rhinocerotis]TDR95677.1 hypothetical protein EV668_0061 [Enterovirga rhinocerotis]